MVNVNVLPEASAQMNKEIDDSSSDFQMTVLLLYIVILLALYVAPLTFTCPCVMDRHSLRPRPDIIGRRGAPMVTRPPLFISQKDTISEILEHSQQTLTQHR